MDMAKYFKMLSIAIIATLVASLILGATGLQTIGPTDKTHRLSPEEHLVGEITGHIELNRDKFAVDWRPGAQGAQSESISVDMAELEVDLSKGDTGLTVSRSVSLDEYWYEWIVDGVLLSKSEKFTGLLNREVSGDGYKASVRLGVPADLNIPDAKPGLVNCRLVANVSATWFDAIFLNEETKTWENLVLAEYGSELVSGAGYAQIGGNLPDTIQTGNDLVFDLRTGYSAGKGWEVKIHPPTHTGISPFLYTDDRFNGQDFFGPKKVTYTIPAEWYKRGADNEGKITVNNGAFTGSMTTFFAVDDINQIPTGGGPTGVIESISGDGKTGSTMTITLSGFPNVISNEQIDYFRVYVYYGSPGIMPGPDFPELYILNGMDVLANNNRASINFVIPDNRPGDITIKANAIDKASRASQGDFWSFTVDKDTPDPVPPDYSWRLNLGSGVLIILAVVAAIMVWLYAPLPDTIKPFGAFIAFVILIFLAYLAGTGKLGGL